MSSFEIEIDPNMLDAEWLDQPVRMLEATEAVAIAKETLAMRKLKRDVLKAETLMNIKACPSDYGLSSKPTVGDINAAVDIDENVVKINKKVIKAESEVALLSAAVTSLDHRKKALENLVTLHGQSYFAGPSVPHKVASVAKAVLDKKAIRAKAGRGI